MTCGEKISKLRKENNLTQEQFAEMLSVSRQSVSKWESGSSFSDTEKLIKISNLFSCSVDYLLKDNIENKDSTLIEKNNEDKQNYIIGIVLTYLSFPPLFGFIVGAYSISYQRKTGHNKKMMLISGIGIIISLIFTITMIAGFVFDL